MTHSRAAPVPRKTHLPHPDQPDFTLCGKAIGRVVGGRVQHLERSAPLQLIGKNEVVDSATCKHCQRADDNRQIRDHQRECKEAGIDPVTLEKTK